MFDDFDTQIQSDELAEIINYTDQFEDPRYLYEEEWFGPLVKRLRRRPFTAKAGVRLSQGSPRSFMPMLIMNKR